MFIYVYERTQTNADFLTRLLFFSSWEASALTTAQSLHPYVTFLDFSNAFNNVSVSFVKKSFAALGLLGIFFDAVKVLYQIGGKEC